MIKEDHLLACTTKMLLEIQQCEDSELLVRFQGRRDSLSQRLGSSRPPVTNRVLNTHPRGLSDYSLVKEQSTNGLVYFRKPSRVPNLFISLSLVSRSGEAEYYRRFHRCQPVLKRFLTDSFQHLNFILTVCRLKSYRLHSDKTA